MRKAFLMEHKHCMVCAKGHTWDVHHIKGRAGALLFDQKWWLPVCRWCHQRIHREPAWARERGYLIYSVAH